MSPLVPFVVTYTLNTLPQLAGHRAGEHSIYPTFCSDSLISRCSLSQGLDVCVIPLQPLEGFGLLCDSHAASHVAPPLLPAGEKSDFTMPGSSNLRRPVLKRTWTWPPTTSMPADGISEPPLQSSYVSAATESKAVSHTHFEDELENPEDHFLSPLYQYEDWADASDDDGDDTGWDAGITDFALFDGDRRGIEDGNGQLPAMWRKFMMSQESALQRSVERCGQDVGLNNLRPPLPCPELTPDTSPSLVDDLETESFDGHPMSGTRAPSYLTVIITPPDEDESSIESDEDMPLSFFVKQARGRLRHRSKVQRPGLQHNRTLSGKLHVWQRPSLYPVGEDPEAEQRAERKCGSFECEEEGRGRR